MTTTVRTTRVLATGALTLLLATTAAPALAQPAPLVPPPASTVNKAQVEHAERQANSGQPTAPGAQDSSGLGAGDWELVLATLLGAVAVGSLAVAAHKVRPSVRTRTS